MSHSPARDQARPDASDNEAAMSDVGSALAASNIIDQYTYASSEAPSSPSMHSHLLNSSTSAGTLKAPDRVPGYFHAKTPSPEPVAEEPLASTTSAKADLAPLGVSSHHASTSPRDGAAMAESLSRQSTFSEESSKAAFRSVDASPSVDVASDGQGKGHAGPRLFAEATARNGSAPPIVRPPPRGKRPPPLMATNASQDAAKSDPQSPKLSHAAQSAEASSSAAAKANTSADADDGSDSDASHYDDQSEEPSNLPTSPASRSTPVASYPAIASTSQGADKEQDKYTNAVDSPDVPRRRSSAYISSDTHRRRSQDSALPSPTASSTRSLRAKNSATAADRTHQDGTKSTPQSADSPYALRHRKSSVASGKDSRKGSTTIAEDTPADEQVEFSARQQAELEKQLTEAADPSRPRTLKEARALAKERAKQRLEAAQGHTDRDPSEDVAPSAAGTFASTEAFYMTATPTAESSLQAGQPTILTTDSSTTARAEADEMSELQAAIGDALHDLSFTSTATAASSLDADHTLTRRRSSSNNDFLARGGSFGRGSSLRPPGTDGHHYQDIDSESNTGASVTSTSFDSARESPIPPSPWSVALSVESAAGAADVPIDPMKGASPTILQGATLSSTRSNNALAATTPNPRVIRGPTMIGSTSLDMHEAPATPLAQHGAAMSFEPHILHTQQRYTAPNKIARLDVYGKTVPWPPAFDPTAIIEQKRLAPWERARSYAHYCNDLATTSTGLHIWLEMVQRPAQRQVAQQQHQQQSFDRVIEVPQHSRGDSAAYAPSVRSDMTFPMRGDGGRARELRGRGPSEATIPESPADRLPPNLPYPLLAQRQQEHLSAAQSSPGMSASASTLLLRQKPQNDSSSSPHGSAGSIDRTQPRNFFQNLGRRGSNRRPGGSGSIGLNISPVVGSNPRSPNAMPSISTPTKVAALGGLNTSISQPSLFHNERANLSTSDISPRLGGKKVLGAQDANPWQSMTSSTSMSLARASPIGPRPPGSGNSTQSSSSGTAQSNSVGHDNSNQGPLSRASSAATSQSLAPDAGKRQAADGSMRHVSPKNAAVPLPGVTPPNTRTADGRRPSGGGNGDDTSSPVSGSGGLLGLAGLRRGSNSIRRSSLGAGHSQRSARGQAQATPTPDESAALDKLSDVLPDADRATLLTYLRRAGGNDVVAIGDYLKDRSKSDQVKPVR